jgi:hypothetical protein
MGNPFGIFFDPLLDHKNMVVVVIFLKLETRRSLHKKREADASLGNFDFVRFQTLIVI